MYDANLVFTEEYDIEGVGTAAQVGDYIDTQVLRSLAGGPGLFLELECLEKPTSSSGAGFFSFQFTLVANDTNSVFTGTPIPVTVAASPVFGTTVHYNGVMPEVGAKILIPLMTTSVNYDEDDQANVTAYGRRFLCLVYTNVARIFGLLAGGGEIGVMTAGKFRCSLRAGNPTGAHAYPTGF